MLGAFTIGEDRRVDHLAAAAALPGIERANEIVVLLSVHPAFALWTFHGGTSLCSWNPSKQRGPKGRAGGITQLVPCALALFGHRHLAIRNVHDISASCKTLIFSKKIFPSFSSAQAQSP